MAKNSSPAFPFIPIILAGIVSFVAGALVMYLVSMKATSSAPSPSVASSTIQDFFDGVSSTVQGKITEISDDMITVENKKGQSQTFKISPTVFISKPGEGGKVATASGEKSAIEKDKDVVLSFAVQEGQYVVMSVIYPVMPQMPQPTN